MPAEDDNLKASLYDLITGADLDRSFVVNFRGILDNDDRGEFDNYLASNYVLNGSRDVYERRHNDHYYPGDDEYEYADDECRFDYHTPECDDYFQSRAEYDNDQWDIHR